MLFVVLLGGLLVFFLLEKMVILCYLYYYEDDGYGYYYGYDKKEVGKVGWMILVGDGLYNFIDGILIVVVFLVDLYLGLVIGLVIIVYEIL